jgi:glutamate decarboxylase
MDPETMLERVDENTIMVVPTLGVSRDMAALLLDDFRDAVAHFRKHPVTVSMTKRESGGFSHL